MPSRAQKTAARVSASPYRHVLPNGITVMALCFGLTSITYAAAARFVAAVACILIAALLDGCDGRVARATNSASAFGSELDSLADVVSFGAAPAFLLYMWGLGDVPVVGWFACLCFLSASALRLARFNVASTDPERPSWHANYFTGVPTPAGACLSLSPIFLGYSELVATENAVTFAAVIVPAVALLMVSNVPTFSAKSVSRKALHVFFLPTIFLAALFSFGVFGWPWITLSLMSGLYILTLPLSIISYRRRRRAA